MKCRECETNIYLYDTLTVQEKEELENHLIICRNCATVFQTVQDQQNLIEQASSFTMSPLDNQQLTDNVMNYVFGTRGKQANSTITVWNYLFKYSFIILCMILTLTFLSEFFGNTISNTDQKVGMTNKHAVLKSPTLREIREEGVTPANSLYAMVKSNDTQFLFYDNNKTQNNENN